MKTFRLIGLAVMAVLMSTSFTACSDDDDDEGGSGTLVTPKYESVSAKYVATSDETEYESVELTASGNYIITLNNYYGGYSSNVKAQANGKQSRVTMLRNKLAATRASFNNIIYGEYTVVSEGVYKLEGFGTITVVKEGDEAASLTIQKNGQDAEVMTAAIQGQCANSNMTNNLCRTWDVETVGMKIVYNGKTVFNKTVDAENIVDLYKALAKLEGDEEDYEDEDYEDYEVYTPEEVVFSKAGTYMVYYKNQTLAVSTWTWVNENKGTLRYSWNYDDMYDEDVAGEATVSFKGNWLYISETESESEDGETYSETVTWGFTEGD